jgi:glycosyltransferase involved in cell wall biosynthesis
VETLQLASVHNVSIVIPTKNSAGYIDIILRHYSRMGLHVTTFVDDSSTDNTLTVCRAHSEHVETISNPVGRTETMIQEISERSHSDWILRFDDDELPTSFMIETALNLSKGMTERQYAFRLVHCLLDRSDQFSALRAFERPPGGPHDQWRLYNRRAIEFTSAIHTPGIKVKNGTIVSPDIFFLHLQWVVRNYEERLQKVASYDRQASNAGSGWRLYYLIEDNSEAWRTSYPVHLPEFLIVEKELSDRFPNALRLP